MSYRERLVDRRALGIRLHALRFEARLTLAEVQDRIGIPEATLARWEKAKGDHYPELDRLIDLCDLYGISFAELVLSAEPDSTTRVRVDPESEVASV